MSTLERTVGELVADVATIKDTLYGKGTGMPGVIDKVNKIDTTITRMEGRFDGFVAFAKLIGGLVGFAVVVCELIRALEPMFHR